MKVVLPAVLFSALLVGGCAAQPETPEPARPQAPWAQLSEPGFPYLLASYGASNVSARKSETLDKYLRSQTKTFDRYIAAREVGADVSPMEQAATSEIQAVSGDLATKTFVVKTTFDLGAYDPALGGFPIFDRFDKNAGIRYYNRDVRTSTSSERKTYGVSFAAEEYGFMEAQVWFSKVGWVLPATQDQAARFLEGLSKTGGQRKVAVAAVFSLGRCDEDSSDKSRLMCEATMRNIYGYNTLEAVRPNIPPLVELVRRPS